MPGKSGLPGPFGSRLLWFMTRELWAKKDPSLCLLFGGRIIVRKVLRTLRMVRKIVELLLISSILDHWAKVFAAELLNAEKY